jgi:hypothetical protein
MELSFPFSCLNEQCISYILKPPFKVVWEALEIGHQTLKNFEVRKFNTEINDLGAMKLKTK